MIEFSHLADDDLEAETFNCDAVDQDEVASDLFIEIWKRYKATRKSLLETQELLEDKKKECQDLENRLSKVLDEGSRTSWYP